MVFAIHMAFEEAILGSQETFVALRTTLIRWHEAELVSVETEIGSCGASLGSRGDCLASQEAVIGSQVT